MHGPIRCGSLLAETQGLMRESVQLVSSSVGGSRIRCDHRRVCVQSDKKILHGSVAIITVEDGEVAVVRNVGKRQTLGPGRYRLEVPQQVGTLHKHGATPSRCRHAVVTSEPVIVNAFVGESALCNCSASERVSSRRCESLSVNFLVCGVVAGVRAPPVHWRSHDRSRGDCDVRLTANSDPSQVHADV